MARRTTRSPAGFSTNAAALLVQTAGVTRLSTITVLNSPGFQARLLVGTSTDGALSPDSPWLTITSHTAIPLLGKQGNTWLLWVRLPTRNGRADINELTARR